MTPSPTYHRIARMLHWGIAVLVLAMIPAGIIMTQDGIPRTVQDTLFLLHKNTGVLIFGLMLWRIAYRALHRPPGLPISVPPWQTRVAKASHLSLYLLLIVMPVSGYVRVRAGDFPIEALDQLGVPKLIPKSEPLADFAKAVHFYAHYIIIALIALHILAALYHALWRRDGVFQRMWPRSET